MNAATIEFALPSPEDTVLLGDALAATLPARAVVHLHGDLGAGKSTLARALLRALGVGGTIRSPTYTLVERYRLRDAREALHLDLYRIGDAGELEFLGLDDSDAALWLVEWPERGGRALPPADLHVHLQVEGTGRRGRLEGSSDAGRDWTRRLAASRGLQAIPVSR